MIANVFGGLRRRPWTALCLGLLTSVTAQTASAADCPGHPDAIGTSRTIVVDPRAHPIVGTMQYGKTLPLEDHEVVLTFDDGPLPKYSNQILDILAAHCAKATFFLVGSQAHANPEGVRKVRDAGHTVATHSQNHPTGMDRLPLDRARQEIDQGIASVTAALPDGTAPAPFLRIPGLRTNDGIEEYAKSKGLQIWSADFPADDWRRTDRGARAQRRTRGVPLPRQTLWPRQMTLPPEGTLAALPVPAASLFRVTESTRVTMLASAPSAPRTEGAAPAPRATEASAKLAGKSRRHSRSAATQPPTPDAGHPAHPPQHADGTPPKPAAPGKKNARSVRVAGLKKR